MGEKLVLHAFAQFRKEYQGESSTLLLLNEQQKTDALKKERRVKAITRRMRPQMDLPQFMELWEQPAPRTKRAEAFHDGWPDFVEWYSAEPIRNRTINLLVAFQTILDFEMNRPYEKWYNGQEKLTDPTDDELLEKTLDSLLVIGQEKRELAAYLKAAKAGKPI